MKTSLFALSLAGAASAHTTVWNILVAGVDQGRGNIQGGYIDSPPNNSPVVDVTSKNMECNVPNIKAAKAVDANAGDEIIVQWYHDNASPSDDIVADSHHGPISMYTSKAGDTLSWVKIAEDGWDGTSWAVDKLRQGTYTGTKGQHKFKIPMLKKGSYVFRPEIIALHEGNRVGGAQFYMECIHINVGGSGTLDLPDGVAIPGYVTANTPGVLFDIYNGFKSYPIPGPKLWDGASGSGGSSSGGSSSGGSSSGSGGSSSGSGGSSSGSGGSGSGGSSSGSGGSGSGGSSSGSGGSGSGSGSGGSSSGGSGSGGSGNAPAPSPTPVYDPAPGNKPAPTTFSISCRPAPTPAGGSFPGGSFPGGSFPGGSGPGGSGPAGGSFPGGSFPGGSFPGGSFPAGGSVQAQNDAQAGGSAPKWGRCGGIGYTGPTACSSGAQCVKQNDWYWQCL